MTTAWHASASASLLAALLGACGGTQPAEPLTLLDDSGTGNASESVDSPDEHGWDLNWSYDCSGSGGRGVFTADVFDADRTPNFKTPGVNEEGSYDSGVYHVPGKGRFYLEITSTCTWTVKVVQAHR